MLRSAENLRATGDPETDAMAKRVLQEEIEKFKKNQARRLARKGDRGDDENRTGVVSKAPESERSAANLLATQVWCLWSDWTYA